MSETVYKNPLSTWSRKKLIKEENPVRDQAFKFRDVYNSFIGKEVILKAEVEVMLASSWLESEDETPCKEAGKK